MARSLSRTLIQYTGEPPRGQLARQHTESMETNAKDVLKLRKAETLSIEPHEVS